MMKLFHKAKDGGAESTVTGYWLIEAKSLFSIVLLKFEGASREAYHSHAFNTISWILKGKLWESVMFQPGYSYSTSLSAGFKSVFTSRERMHKVDSGGTTWVLSFRGPWAETWREYRPKEYGDIVTLTSGRKEVGRYNPHVSKDTQNFLDELVRDTF
jgi:hypothetical protein